MHYLKYPVFNKKETKHANKQDSVIHTQETQPAIVTAFAKAQILDLGDKDLKADIIKVF